MPSRPDTDEDPFLLTSELAIRSTLRTIQRRASLVRMYIKGTPDQSIVTTVLSLDDETGHVVVDSSSDTDFNTRVVQATEVVFDTQVDHINVNFIAGGLRNITHDGLPAIAFPYPTSVRRVQRREFFRVEIPVGEPATCAIRLSPQDGKPARSINVKMKDLSVGGVALLDTDGQLPHQSGAAFKGAKLTLPEVGEVTIDLEVLRVHTMVLPSKKEIVELGCKFVNPTNADTQMVQSYIGRLERRLNAKRRGF